MLQIKRILKSPCLPVLNNEQLKEYINNLLDIHKGGYSVAVNAIKIVLYNKNKEVQTNLNNSVLPTPDGFGAVLAYKLFDGKNIVKIDLPGLMFEIADERNAKSFFLGAKEESNIKAVEKIKVMYPGINFVGRQNGYFSNKKELLTNMEKLQPNIVFIAMGSPKQELLAEEFYNEMPNTLFIGCGGRFDILAGNLKRAPEFFIKLNLEWLYRLAQEPTRIKKQLPLFAYLYLLTKELFKRKLLRTT